MKISADVPELAVAGMRVEKRWLRRIRAGSPGGYKKKARRLFSSHRANFDRDGRIELRWTLARPSSLPSRTIVGIFENLNDASGRTGEPLNSMDPTTDVGMSNPVENQGVFGDPDVESRESVCRVAHLPHTPGAYSSQRGLR
jgi:hypothetical protein